MKDQNQDTHSEQSRTNAVTTISENYSTISNREKSVSQLEDQLKQTENISKIDALILRRANVVISLGFVPDWTDQERSDILNEFRKALRDHPAWAINQAIDRWTKTSARRPSPAELVMLADKATQPIRDELADRKKQQQRSEQHQIENQRGPVDKDAAAAICAAAGFTPKHFEHMSKRGTRMMRDRSEIENMKDKPRVPHWTETVAPDSPQMDQLRKARDENDLIKKSREMARMLEEKARQ